MAFADALFYHKVDFFYFAVNHHPNPSADKFFPLSMTVMNDENFWRKYWTDAPSMLESILNSDVERCCRGTKGFVHVGSIDTFRSLLRSTTASFKVAELMIEKPIATYPRYYLWHYETSRIVHSHSALFRILHRMKGWEADLPMMDRGMRFYVYNDPEDGEIALFGFAWPDLLKTPVLHLLRFSRFVREPRGRDLLPPIGPRDRVFSLREYIPHDVYECFSARIFR